MGDLILCQTGIAAMPYYIEGADLNIYSLEELCYYLGHETDRIGDNFCNQELVQWIKEELGCTELAKELEEARENHTSLAEQIGILSGGCSYFSKKERLALIHQIVELENKSAAERERINADRCLKNKQYVKSILCYRRLLSYPDGELSALDKGNIWHNMGVANAQMFLYEQAAECFKKAYEYNNNPESEMERYFAMQCVSQKEQAGDYEPPEEWKSGVMERLQQAVDTIESQENTGLSKERIPVWKERYRIYSRV